jgi:hypothetical protein
VHAKLEARESELAAVRLRLMDAEVGWAKSKAEADTLRASAGTQAAAGLNMDVDRVMSGLMERARSVGAEMASVRSAGWMLTNVRHLSLICPHQGL